MSQYSLPRATPESQGISSGAILNFVQAVEKEIHEFHSFMLLRHGQAVAEGWWAPHAPERPHMLFSLSKSFTSSAVGLAVAEGRLTVNDPVVSFFPDDLPAEVSPNLKGMRVKQLLSMCTGHQDDTMGALFEQPEGNFVRGFLALPVPHKPGTHFLYNTGASYMLSAIVQKVTGQTLIEYLTPRLFEPLGIQGAAWESCPRGINMGGFGLSVRTEDIARFGQLYLQKGVWNGKRILPAEWVEEASARQVSNGFDPQSDWDQGYGYQFWRCKNGAYRGDGAFGQYCVVMPEQDAVLAITGGLGDMQAPLNLVWQHLLPAMRPAPLPANESAQAELKQKLAGLALGSPEGKDASPLEAKINGKRFRMDENKMRISTATFQFEPGKVVLTFEGAQPGLSVACGRGALLEGVTGLAPRGELPVAAAAAWTGEQALTLTLRYYETPFVQTLTCDFNGDDLTVLPQMNVSFGPLEGEKLAGRMEK